MKPLMEYNLNIVVSMSLTSLNSTLILILYILLIPNTTVRTSLLSIIVVTLGILSICAIYRAVRDIEDIL